MSSFFTNGFASKREEPRRGSSSPPDEEEDTSTAKAGTVAGDSWAMLHDHEGGPVWTGDWIYYSTPVPQSFSNLHTPSPALSAQPLATHGYPAYVYNAGLYEAAPQTWAVAPPPTTVVMPPVVPAPSVEGKKKSSEKYYV